MDTILTTIARIWGAPDLRRKILYTLGCLFVFRLVGHITVPGVNHAALTSLFSKNELLGVFSILTGGGLEHFSVVLMGLTPYINASIIIQLLTVIIPRWEEMKKEGESGTKRLNQYTRWLTIPLAFLQSYGMIVLLNRSASAGGESLITNISDPWTMIPMMLTVTAGTVFLMWLGEVMTERGIGNGISLLIFASIVAGIPPVLGQTLGLAQFDQTKIIPLAIVAVVTIALTALVVLVTEGVRQIPVTYARRGTRGASSTLPIRVNQAGMIPIIFSVSLITFPTIIAQFLQGSTNETVRTASRWLIDHLNASSPGPLYMGLYFGFVVAFTYFYVSITFNPEQVAENIQKRGGFVPGLRPGSETAGYLAKVSNHLNLWGGTFIGLVGLLPMLIHAFFSGQSFGTVPLLISGSGLIIIVGVVLELIRQVKAQMIMHDYDRFK